MTTATLRVVATGPHVTVQDGGRAGLMRYGVPRSGPVDRMAFAAANLALGNGPGAPGIEVSLGGLRIECLSGTVGLAIAGGGFVVEVGESRQGSWTTLSLAEGQTLTIRPGPWGTWTYLAFAGSILTDRWLGSAATHAASRLGGGALHPGQVLEIADARPVPQRQIPCPVWARSIRRVRCVLGPQDRFFAPETVEDFVSGVFSITQAYDRMGVRLNGPPLIPAGALAIPSEPIVRGSVQVSGDGVATVLLADHQTTGGYPKIATVIAADLDAFAQCRPKDNVAFHAISPDEAVGAARAAQLRFDAWAAALGRWRDRGDGDEPHSDTD